MLLGEWWGPFPDVGNPGAGVGLGKVGSDLQGLCDSLAEVSRRQSDAWVWTFWPEMQIRGHEVKGGCPACPGTARYGRVGPGTARYGSGTWVGILRITNI